MEDENTVEGETLEPQVEEETPTESSEEQVDIEALKREADLARNYKIRAEKAEAEAKKLKSRPVELKDSVDSIDLIKLGKKLQNYSDDELDFVTKFAGTKKPEEVLKALENPFVQQGIQAHREKVEKEKAVKPSGGSPTVEVKKSIKDILATGTLEEKEKALEEIGMIRNPRPRADRVTIR